MPRPDLLTMGMSEMALPKDLPMRETDKTAVVRNRQMGHGKTDFEENFIQDFSSALSLSTEHTRTEQLGKHSREYTEENSSAYGVTYGIGPSWIQSVRPNITSALKLVKYRECMTVISLLPYLPFLSR